jgi:hypothetical protein
LRFGLELVIPLDCSRGPLQCVIEPRQQLMDAGAASVAFGRLLTRGYNPYGGCLFLPEYRLTPKFAMYLIQDAQVVATRGTTSGVEPTK